MKTHVARLTVFRTLLNITDLLAPHARTHVMSRVIINAMKSGGRPKTVPKVSLMLLLMLPPASESKLALRAHAHALVPIRYSRIMFHPMTNATNSPTET
jgi:hypothetical protein